MAFDPSSDYSSTGASAGAFPGSVDAGVQAQDAQLGLSTKLAAIPVILNKGASSKVLLQHGEVPDPTQIAKVVRFDEALNSLNGMTSDEVEQLQNQLYSAGFFASSYYGKKPPTIVKGMVDAATSKAWENALLQSAKDQDAVGSTLSSRAAQRQAAGLPTTLTDTSNAVTLTHPEDLRAALRAAGASVIGRNPDAAVEENFISAYHNAQVSANKPDASGNYVAAPDPSALAHTYLQTVYPQEAYDNGVLGSFDTFRKMISGG